jgi:hypothetical protein
MPGLIVRKKIVPSNAKIEGPYIRLHGTRGPNQARHPDVQHAGHTGAHGDARSCDLGSMPGVHVARILRSLHNPADAKSFRPPRRWSPAILGLVYCFINTFDLPNYGGHRRIVI